MKRVRLCAVLLLLVALGPSVMAGARHKGGKLEHRWMKEDSILSSLNLTAEQLEKIRILRESFEKDVGPLRSQKYERKAELRLLWMEPHPDHGRIRAKEKELHDLMWRLIERVRDYRLAFRDILSPEQLSEFLNMGGDRQYRHHAGKSTVSRSW